jgi:hypothetical protein
VNNRTSIGFTQFRVTQPGCICAILDMLLRSLSDESFVRVEHESLCGDGCGSTSYMGDLGWCNPTSITTQTLDGCFWWGAGYAS